MEDRMLSDEVLLALIKKNSGGGGGGGTNDYTQLRNLPQINSVELTGNKSLSDLGIASEDSLASILDAIAEEFDATVTYAVGDYTIEEGVLYRCTAPHTGAWDANDFTETTVSDEILSALSAISGILDGTDIDSFGDVETALSGKQDTLTFDNAPTENSNNPVKSGGVYTALAGKQDTLTFDNTPTEDSNNPVKSGGIYDALSSKANASDVKKEFGGTLEQWNALTTTEKKEYDAYDITDDYSDGNYIYLPTIYSEEEREVGVWKNGKPLYQKVWTVTLPSTHDLEGSAFLIDSDVSYIDEIAMSGGYIQAPTGVISALNGGIPSIAGWNYGIHINSSSNLGIYTGSSSTLIGGGTAVVILQYTKTTDTAGSGTWTPTGQYAEHYSTDEQIIGTWVDGKTLYRRVINAGTLPNNTSKKIELGLNFDNVINIRGFVKAGNDGFLPLPFVSFDGSTSYSTWVKTDSNGDLILFTNAAFGTANYEAYVILEYTKTTV